MKDENARGAAKNPNCGTGPSRDPHCGICSTPKVFRVRVNAVDSYCLKALDSLSFRFSMEQKVVQGGGRNFAAHCTTSVLSRIGLI